MSEEIKKDQEVENAVENQTAEQPVEELTSKKEKKRRHGKNDENEEKLQELGEKLAAANDKYVRIYSEYENYRKRTNLEKADLLINGAKDTIKAILPVVDDMERALSALSDDDKSKEGVQLIYNKLINILTQKGLKPIEAKGQKFDENLHEAITQFPAQDDSQKGMVVDVVEKGYFLNDKVLRYAKVVVAI
ncbi:MAG: nucleotide exchange factor GrpE [Bacteroidales bacterium]|nr:nucleotide exchange factor GrpE [Bacteroidales bacterium]